jgi:uncharacterized protein (DUF1501 family)
MNRLLGALPGATDAAATRAVSVGPVLPRSLDGRHPVANLALGRAATRPAALDRPRIGAACAQLYAGDDASGRAFREAQRARREMQAALAGDGERQHEMQAASNGAPLPDGFADDAARLARLMRNDAHVQLAFMALGGWDTHANQGAAEGQLARRLGALGDGLAALAAGLGPVLDESVVVVLSEFGRTLRENGNRGTDHGHGNVMWLMGARVAGGKVHGRWPGLEASALYEGRDLAVTTDFRQVLAQVCARHLGLADARLADVFPRYAGDAANRLELFA